MTEHEWLACTDPTPMVKYLRRRKASARKWRLATVACCRRRWHLLNHPRVQEAILVAERFADGEATKEELTAADKASYEVYLEDQRSVFDPGRNALGAASGTAMTIPGHAFNRAIWRIEPSEVCNLLREFFGNPFRPVAIAPAVLAWNDAAVVRLAQAAYDERHLPEGTLDNGRLAVLADALEEAGCTSEEILGHLRGSGPHVRGCFVLDLLLNRE
jgi:hypothetical protein